MFKRLTLLILGLMTLTGLTGCMENAMLLKLNTDGSGTLTYRVFMSDDMLNMAQTMASGMMQGMGMDEAETQAVADPFADIKASLDGQFGPQAKLESSRELTNKQGWKGIEAVYAFDDVNDLDLQNVEAVQAEGPAMQMDQVGSAYKFDFTPGDVATLKMTPLADESPDEAAASEMPDMSAAMGGMDGMMEGMGMQMMAPMMKGMRMSFLIFVNGEVVETNAKFQSQKHPNVITLTDMQFDKILADPNGADLMKDQKMDPAKLAAMDVNGLRVEDPDKVIEIRFK